MLLQFPSPTAKPDQRTAPLGGWSQQELADLYRVEALLIQAGMRIETERGLTDEGDPWFVFCQPDGDVFVHLCRIDGDYLLDSPGLDRPLTGADFQGLIDQFVRSVAARAASSNVVQFRRANADSTVRLHPALMLTALIWSLYLASDMLAETAHAAEFSLDGEDASPLFGLSQAQAAAGEIDALLGQLDNGSAVPLPAEGLGLSERMAIQPNREQGGLDLRGLWSGQAASVGLAATLTAIAVTFGLYEYGTGGVFATAFSPETGTDHSADNTALELVVASGTRFDGRTFSHDAAIETAAVAPEAAKVVFASAVSELDHAGPIILTPQATVDLSIEDVQPRLSMVQDHSDVLLLPRPNDTVVLSGPAVTAGSVQTAESDIGALLELAEKHLGGLSSFTIDGVSFLATIDPSKTKPAGGELTETDEGDLITIDPADLADLLDPGNLHPGLVAVPPTGTPANPAGLSAYDEAAKAFIHKFLSQSNSVEMVMRNNTLFFLDLTALDEVTDRPVTWSWILDDQTMVTAIGHSDYFTTSGLLLV